MMTKETSPQPSASIPSIAIDDGFAQTKVAYRGADGGIKTHLIRSAIRHGAVASVSGGGAVATYRTDDGMTVMTVSDDVAGEATAFDGFHLSAMNRILVAHSLRSGGVNSPVVDICAGLPIGDFFSGTSRNETFIAKKEANLRVKVEPFQKEDAPCSSYRKINIGCQAIAAFLDYALDDDLEPRNVSTDRVAVVDIGGRTTDIAVILNGRNFDDTRSGTDNIGVLEVHRNLTRLLMRTYDVSDKTFSDSVIDLAVRHGQIKLWGKVVDISDLVAQARADVEQRLTSTISRRLGNGSDLDAVLFVGGGARLFSGSQAAFRNAVMPRDAEFSNARGLLKNMEIQPEG